MPLSWARGCFLFAAGANRRTLDLCSKQECIPSRLSEQAQDFADRCSGSCSLSYLPRVRGSPAAGVEFASVAHASDLSRLSKEGLMSKLVATAVLVSFWTGVAVAGDVAPRHFVDLDNH